MRWFVLLFCYLWIDRVVVRVGVRSKLGIDGLKEMDGYMDEWMMLHRTCGLNLGGRNGRMGGGGWMVRSGMVEGRNGLLGDLWYIVLLLLILLLVLLVLLFRCVLLGRVSCWGRVSCELCAVR